MRDLRGRGRRGGADEAEDHDAEEDEKLLEMLRADAEAKTSRCREHFAMVYTGMRMLM